LENRSWQKLYDFNVPVSIRYPQVPVQNLFHLTATAFPDKAALSMGGSELTFCRDPGRIPRETLKAHIVLKPCEAATDKEIIAFCRERLTAYKVPKLVEFRDALPKSSVGKILRKLLREEEMTKGK
jgi:acyl-CoA synthetase (AMP-forming)/AMP-acid ligase II